MKSIAIYSYMDKWILVPKQKRANGLTTSQSKFKVITMPMNKMQVWQEIIDSLDEFAHLSEEYDRLKGSGFNSSLAKSAGASSFKKFWQNSQMSQVHIDGKDCILEHLQRATEFKGYQGTGESVSKYNLDTTSGDMIVDEIIKNLIPD